MRCLPPSTTHFNYYDTKLCQIMFPDYGVKLSAHGGRAVTDLLRANGMPLPPQPEPVQHQPADTSQTAGRNTYTVQANESAWRIAGNDPQLVQWIYDHNLWLNERMERDTRPINARGGQNPNYIEVGDVLVLPEGYHAPK